MSPNEQSLPSTDAYMRLRLEAVAAVATDIAEVVDRHLNDGLCPAHDPRCIGCHAIAHLEQLVAATTTRLTDFDGGA